MTSNPPFVSVLMPIRNEADFIERSLGAVLTQDYPHDCMEVLVADGMSTDSTRGVITSLAERHPDVYVRILDNPGQIVPSGMNLALAEARGEYIVRVDGHTIIAPDYVRNCVETLKRSGADNVGGRMDAVSEGAFGRAVAAATSSPFGVGGSRFHYSDREEWVDSVYMGAWPAAVFRRIGGFDEELVRNQDDELNYRLSSLGGKILLNPQIKSCYYNRSTPKALWRQYFQYGYWKVRVMQKHPRQMSLRHFAPPGFAALLGGALLLFPLSRISRLLLASVVLVYTLANLAASAWAARKASATSIASLSLAFGIIHLSYGVGFLTGLIKFRNRWSAAAASSPEAVLVAVKSARASK